MATLEEQREMFINRVAKTAKHRRRWAKRENISCYRIYERDIPEVPLVVDWYDGRLHIAEFYRHGDEKPDGWADDFAAALAERLGVRAEWVWTKTRERQKGTSQYTRQGAEGATFEVEEGGLCFEVNLSDYLDTGLFLDHRPARAMIQAQAKGLKVVNLFGYTGSFVVHAARGGAVETLSVDMSTTYTDWTTGNLARNGFGPPAHRAERADVLQFLEAPGRRAQHFDLAIVDPPTFSNSKRMETTFDVQRDHVDLLRGAAGLVRAGGRVFFSTNRRGFKLDDEALAGWAPEELTGQTVPDDFSRTRPHRSWWLHIG